MKFFCLRDPDRLGRLCLKVERGRYDGRHVMNSNRSVSTERRQIGRSHNELLRLIAST